MEAGKRNKMGSNLDGSSMEAWKRENLDKILSNGCRISMAARFVVNEHSSVQDVSAENMKILLRKNWLDLRRKWASTVRSMQHH